MAGKWLPEFVLDMDLERLNHRYKKHHAPERRENSRRRNVCSSPRERRISKAEWNVREVEEEKVQVEENVGEERSADGESPRATLQRLSSKRIHFGNFAVRKDSKSSTKKDKNHRKRLEIHRKIIAEQKSNGRTSLEPQQEEGTEEKDSEDLDSAEETKDCESESDLEGIECDDVFFDDDFILTQAKGASQGTQPWLGLDFLYLEDFDASFHVERTMNQVKQLDRDKGKAEEQENETKVDLSKRSLNDISFQKKLVEGIGRVENSIERLDLSSNKLCCTSRGILGPFYSTLLALDLSSNQLSDGGFSVLLEGLQPFNKLQDLSVSRNRIMGARKQIFTLLAQFKSLKKVDMSWNMLNCDGIASFAKVVAVKDHCLEDLNLSANQKKVCFFDADMGKERDKLHAFFTALGGNKTLKHLDLSMNNLCYTSVADLAKAITNNHTLRGIHLRGNMGRVDASGFVIPMSQVEQGDFNENCWICEKWKPVKFTWKEAIPAVHVTEESSSPARIRTQLDERNWRKKNNVKKKADKADECEAEEGMLAEEDRGPDINRFELPTQVAVHLPQLNWKPWPLVRHRKPVTSFGPDGREQYKIVWETTVVLPVREKIPFYFSVDEIPRVSVAEPQGQIAGEIISDDRTRQLDSSCQGATNWLDYRLNDFFQARKSERFCIPRLSAEQVKHRILSDQYFSWSLSRCTCAARATQWPSKSLFQETPSHAENLYANDSQLAMSSREGKVSSSVLCEKEKKRSKMNEEEEEGLDGFFQSKYFEIVSLFSHFAHRFSGDCVPVAGRGHSLSFGAYMCLINLLGLIVQEEDIKVYTRIFAVAFRRQQDCGILLSSKKAADSLKSENPNAPMLARPFWFQLFSQLAKRICKQRSSTETSTLDACEELLKRIKAQANEKLRNSDKLRAELLYQEETDMWFRAHSRRLKQIFHQYVAHTRRGMTLKEFLVMLEDINMFRFDALLRSDAVCIFDASCPFLESVSTERELSYFDFLEAFLRLALIVPVAPRSMLEIHDTAEMYRICDLTGMWAFLKTRNDLPLNLLLQNLLDWIDTCSRRTVDVEEREQFWADITMKPLRLEKEVLTVVLKRESEIPTDMANLFLNVHLVCEDLLQRTRPRAKRIRFLRELIDRAEETSASVKASPFSSSQLLAAAIRILLDE